MIDEKTLSALAEALGDTGHQVDDDDRALAIIEMLAAKDFRLFHFPPGELKVVEPIHTMPSLRDVYAGEAFAAFMASLASTNIYSSHGARKFALASVREFASFCFEAADIMMEARDA